jgi:hypothetical protein
MKDTGNRRTENEMTKGINKGGSKDEEVRKEHMRGKKEGRNFKRKRNKRV